MKLTSEQRPAFNRAAAIYSEASGINPAAAIEALESDTALLDSIATGLRQMSPTSPLADEIDLLPKE